MRKSRALLLGILLAGALACQAAARSVVDQRPTTLTLLHTNDTHSHLEPFTPSGEPEQGGAARRKTLIDRIRARVGADHVLLVDAGDFSQGTVYYNAWRGSASVMAMNAMGYDVVTLGNHEFDQGPENLGRLLQGGSVTIAGKDYPVERPRFRVVSANLDVAAEPALAGLLTPSTVVVRAGTRIGLIGVVTETLPRISAAGSGVRVADYLASVQRAADALRAEGVRCIVLLSHAGYRLDVRQARRLSGIDVIVSGHDHKLTGDAALWAQDPRLSFLATRVAGPYPTVVRGRDGHTTLVVSAYEWGRVLGHLDVSFDAEGHVSRWSGGPMLVDARVPADPELAAKVASYRGPLDAFVDTAVGRAAAAFDGSRDPGLRSREMPLGDLVADVVLTAAAESDGAVAALINGGSIRDGLPQGKVSFGKLLEVLPFGNTVAVVDVTGEELLEALDNGLTHAGGRASGAFPQVAGMELIYCAAAPCARALRPGGRVMRLSVAGRPWDPQTSYRLAANGFMTRGQDYYRSLQRACRRPGGYCRDTGMLMLDLLVHEFRWHSPVSRATDGRLVAR